MMPEVGVVDMMSYHLKLYICRLKGFSDQLQQPISTLVDSDLEACILGSSPTVELIWLS